MEIQKVRDDLLQGIKSPSCSSCWKKEEISNRSMRMSYANMFKLSGPISDVDLKNIVYLDVSFSNICNLRCRFCGPDRSSKWKTDVEALYKKNFKFWDGIFSLPESLPIPSPEELAHFIDQLPSLHTLNINGGEPFADPRHRQFLQALIESGKAPRLRLLYTSNGTRAPMEELRLLESFKSVEVMFSVEGTGALYRYIRGDHFSLEDHVSKNITRFSVIPNITLGIHSTMSVYNAWSLEDVFRWKLEMEKIVGNLIWQIGLVASPGFLSPHMISEKERQKIAASLPDSHPNFAKWRQILLSPSNKKIPGDSKALSELKQYNKDLDELRGESLEKSVPKLHQYLQSLEWEPS